MNSDNENERNRCLSALISVIQKKAERMNGKKNIELSYTGDSGQEVYLAADFTQWKKVRMEEIAEENGCSRYHCNEQLPPGRYQYKFVVNGQWINDPDNPETVMNDGFINSVFVIDDMSDKVIANITESTMKVKQAKQDSGSGEEKMDWSKGADIRTVRSIACPLDSDSRKKVDEAVIEKFQKYIGKRCEQVKELLKTIEEYSAVSNGLVKMEGDILYLNTINAVMPKKLPKADAFIPCRDLANKLQFSGYLPFGKDKRFQGVLPTYDELASIEEIPNNPLENRGGTFVLCTNVPVVTNFWICPAGCDYHELSVAERYESFYDAILPKAEVKKKKITKNDKGEVIANAELGKMFVEDPFCRYNRQNYNRGYHVIDGKRGYANYDGNNGRGHCFIKYPIFRLQDGIISKALTKGYELFAIWSMFGLEPEELYTQAEHIAMSGVIDSQVVAPWLKKFKEIKKWFVDNPELFDVSSASFLSPENCLKEFKAGKTVLGYNREAMNKEVISRKDNTGDEAVCAIAIERLLNCDLLRSDIRPAYDKPCLTDSARGHWDLWGENGAEAGEASILVPCDLLARNPKLDIKGSGVIGIDFGTKSTTVVRYIDKEKPAPMRIGYRDFSKIGSGSQDANENPTIVQFRDIETFMQDYAKKAGRPPTMWNDLTVSHEAERTLSNCDNGPLYASFLNELKQWAGGKESHRVKDTKGYDFELRPFMELGDEDIDPIELYAYEIGLQINNMANGIFMRYELSYPIKYAADVRERLRLSFERGLKKSLPVSVLKDSELMSTFKVRMRVSEPAAYALCALQELNLVPRGKKQVFYGVFDFGGGTTDFDYGICREGNEEEQDENYYTVIEHFAPHGDKYLGGENLLQLMAYEVFKQNIELLMKGGSNKGEGDGEKKKEKSMIPFAKPFEDSNTDFPGSERLVSNSAEARLNMHTVMNALRPLWEESNNSEAAAKIGNKLSVTLFNQDGRPISNVELSVDTEKLKALLKKRIGEGVSEFFTQLRAALNIAIEKELVSDIHQIHILLAGNSSKSPIVRESFEERIKGFKAGFTQECQKETDFKIELHNPLGFEPAETHKADEAAAQGKVEKEGEKANKKRAVLDPTKPTGKTGVAFGLVYARDGGDIKVVDHDQDSSGQNSFRFYVGKSDRDRKFKTLLSRHTEVKTWVKILSVAERETVELRYTEKPSAETDQMSVEKALTLTIPVSQPAEKDFKLFVRIASSESIEYVLAKSEADIKESKIKSITLA